MAKALRAILLLLPLVLLASVPGVASAQPENSGDESRITAQQTAPSVSLAAANVQVRLNSPVSITATFSEPVFGFTIFVAHPSGFVQPQRKPRSRSKC